MITVAGDSMEPLFLSGDRVLIDVSRKAPVPPGIFVIWDGMGWDWSPSGSSMCPTPICPGW